MKEQAENRTEERKKKHGYISSFKLLLWQPHISWHHIQFSAVSQQEYFIWKVHTLHLCHRNWPILKPLVCFVCNFMLAFRLFYSFRYVFNATYNTNFCIQFNATFIWSTKRDALSASNVEPNEFHKNMNLALNLAVLHCLQSHTHTHTIRNSNAINVV